MRKRLPLYDRAGLEITRIGYSGGPNNLHAEPTVVAAQAGKHVICETPPGRDAAVGTIEATRFANGRKNAFRWEINGSKPGKQAQGFRTVLVSEADVAYRAAEVCDAMARSSEQGARVTIGYR